jgi:hypothetical protein
MKPLGRRIVHDTPEERTASSEAIHMLTMALLGVPAVNPREKRKYLSPSLGVRLCLA